MLVLIPVIGVIIVIGLLLCFCVGKRFIGGGKSTEVEVLIEDNDFKTVEANNITDDTTFNTIIKQLENDNKIDTKNMYVKRIRVYFQTKHEDLVLSEFNNKVLPYILKGYKLILYLNFGYNYEDGDPVLIQESEGDEWRLSTIVYTGSSSRTIYDVRTSDGRFKELSINDITSPQEREFIVNILLKILITGIKTPKFAADVRDKGVGENNTIYQEFKAIDLRTFFS